MNTILGNCPETRVVLDVADAALAPAPGALERLGRVVAEASERALGELGIGISAEGAVRPVDAARGSHVPFSVRVGDARFRCSQELAARILAAVAGAPVRTADPSALAEWLRRELAGPGLDRLEAYVRLLVREVLQRHAGQLMDAAQAERIRDSLVPLVPQWRRGQPGAPSTDWLVQALTPILEVRLSLADVEQVADAIRERLVELPSPEEASEILIAALRRNVVLIRIRAEDLRRLTLAADGEPSRPFAQLRAALFQLSGIVTPRFAFVEDPSLARGTVAFGVEGVVGIPWTCLDGGELLVGEEPALVTSHGIEVLRPAINPASGSECAVVAASGAERARVGGLTTWNAMEYVALCLEAELKDRLTTLVDVNLVDRSLDQLEREFPELVRVARAGTPSWRLAAALRCLVDERVSIRNVRHILQAVLDYDVVVADGRASIVFDERLIVPSAPAPGAAPDPCRLAEFVRKSLRRSVISRHEDRHGTVDVLVVDVGFEALFAEAARSGARLAPDFEDRVTDAVAGAVGTRGGTSSRDVLLIGGDGRRRLHQVLAPVLPRLTVLGYEDLPPEASVRPIGRVELPGAGEAIRGR